MQSMNTSYSCSAIVEFAAAAAYKKMGNCYEGSDMLVGLGSPSYGSSPFDDGFEQPWPDGGTLVACGLLGLAAQATVWPFDDGFEQPWPDGGLLVAWRACWAWQPKLRFGAIRRPTRPTMPRRLGCQAQQHAC